MAAGKKKGKPGRPKKKPTKKGDPSDTIRTDIVKKATKEELGRNKAGLSRKQKLKKEEIYTRRLKVARYVVEFGLSNTDMASRLSVHEVTIAKDIEWLEKVWKDEAVKDVEAAKQKAIRRLNFALRETRLAFEKSKTGQKILKSKTKSGGKGGTETEKSRLEKDSPGDVRFLELYVETTEKIAELEGVDKKDMIKNFNLNIMMPQLPEEMSRFGLTGEQKERKKIEEAEDAEYVEDDGE